MWPIVANGVVEVPDIVVRIYLYFLIGLSVFSFLLFAASWFFQSARPRRFLIKAKLLWRNLFFLLSGLLALYFFRSRRWENWLILVLAFILLVLSTYAAELIERVRSKSAEDGRAT